MTESASPTHLLFESENLTNYDQDSHGGDCDRYMMLIVNEHVFVNIISTKDYPLG